MSTELQERLGRVETALKALVMLQIRTLQMPDDRARAESRSLESLLKTAGYESQAEIGEIMNKTRQAVSQRLKSEEVHS